MVTRSCVLFEVARLVSNVRAIYNDPSKLAWSLLDNKVDQSKRARVKEHRLSENTIGLVCGLPRAQGLTRLIPPHSGVGVGRAQETIGLPSLLLCALARAQETNSLHTPSSPRAHSGSTGAIWVSFLSFLLEF